MIEQQGRVLSLVGESASIRIGATEGCPACDSGKGCGAGIFGRILKRKLVVIELENVVGAQPGEDVTIGIPENVFLKLLLRLYLLPLIAALAGAAVGHYFAGIVTDSWAATDGLTLVGSAFAGGVALWLGGRSHTKLYRKSDVQIVCIVPVPHKLKVLNYKF